MAVYFAVLLFPWKRSTLCIGLAFEGNLRHDNSLVLI